MGWRRNKSKQGRRRREKHSARSPQTVPQLLDTFARRLAVAVDLPVQQLLGAAVDNAPAPKSPASTVPPVRSRA